MTGLACRYSRIRMGAFLAGELNPKARRAIARHLDQCPACARIRDEQRAAAIRLRQDLPAFGRPSSGTLAHLWQNIDAELNQPEIAPRQHISPSYALISLAIVLLLLVPVLTIRQPGTIPLSVPSQPAPETALVVATPGFAVATMPTHVALVSETRPVPEPQQQHLLNNTPAPDSRTN